MFTFKPLLPRWTMPGILLALVLCGASAPHAAAGPQTIPLLVGDTLDEQGKPRPVTGAKRKLFDALERELGVAFELRMYPWARAERYALEGGGLIYGLPKTADRLRALRYSEAASHRTLWLVTRSDATFDFNTLEDLRGKTLGIVRGYSYGEEFDNARGKLFRTEDDISSRGTRLTRLMLKRVDAILLFQPSTQSAKDVEAEIAAFMAPRLRAIGAAANAGYSVLPKPVANDTHQFFAIARGRDDGIIDRINAALARIQQRPPNLILNGARLEGQVAR
ncbi:substrate-binding periplasmic protein [Duganella sp. CT11-25]|jgi:ABC-type amino acid transport substrate-binding protein|uniref:substrate-binding periplasmic protein n=1 Tax=unclassified Duganella TaxID=2636909 RepID=UPI0039AFD297